MVVESEQALDGREQEGRRVCQTKKDGKGRTNVCLAWLRLPSPGRGKGKGGRPTANLVERP